MVKIRSVDTDAVDWIPVHDAVAPATAARMAPTERDADVRLLHTGQDGGPQLFEVRFAADENVSLHAHSADEIIWKRTQPRLIQRFPDFRADANTSFITRAEFLAARAAAKSGAAER